MGEWFFLLQLVGPVAGWVIANKQKRRKFLVYLSLNISWGVLCLGILKINDLVPVSVPIVLVEMTVGIAILSDYLNLKIENRSLEYLATYDGLTEIPNRRQFDQYFQQEWKRMAREKSYLSLIFCDVDFFKLYNDKYGHQAGDLCLKKVAQSIQKSIKRPADLAARYGGEEFVVVLPNTNWEGAVHIAQEISREIQSLKITHGASQVSDYITLSLGIVSAIPNPDLPHGFFLKAADEALYEAKEQGRDRYFVSPISD
jgi:diguanylate cyclase (GGDEF)-like protein